MRIFGLTTVIATAFAFNANAQATLNENINWNEISTTPSVSAEETILQNNGEESRSILDEIMSDEYSFLTQENDERVFYNFDAEIRVLNKQIDKIFDLSLQPNMSAKVKKYDISIKSCATAMINNTENHLAFLTVNTAEKEVFKGWMSNIYKNLNFPELPELNISLLDCTKVEGPIPQPLQQEPEVNPEEEKENTSENSELDIQHITEIKKERRKALINLSLKIVTFAH